MLSLRMKVRLTAIGLCMLAFVVGWLAYNGGTYTIRMSQEEVQERINAAIDRQDTAKDRLIKVDSIELWFSDDNHIRVDAALTGTYRNHTISADASSEGAIEYRSGAFFFHPLAPVSVENIRMEKSDKSPGSFDKTKELIKKKAEEFASSHGLGEITQTFKDELAQRVKNATQKRLASAFATHPIYTLHGTKGLVVRAVLKKVEVVDQKLVVTLSLVQLGISITIAATFLICGLALFVVLLAYPDMGLMLTPLI